MSQVTDKIHYIPLETDSASLIGNISKIHLTEKHIFVADPKRLLQFDLSGNFIRRIGQIGRGPGEHGKYFKFAVDEFHDEVFIFSSGQVNVYELATGDFLRQFGVEFEVSGFDAISGGELIFVTRELPSVLMNRSVNEIFLVDSKGNLLDSIPDFGRKNREIQSIVGYTTYRKDDRLFFINVYKDTLLYLTPDLKKEPYAQFNFENSIDPNQLKFKPEEQELFKDYIYNWGVLENKGFIFADVRKGIVGSASSDVLNVIFDKSSDESKMVESIHNDVDGGIKFWPKWQTSKALIDARYPFEFLEYYESTKDKGKLKESFVDLVQKLDENDNPVLIVIE